MTNALLTRSRWAYGIALGALGLMLAAITAAVLHAGPAVQTIYGHDIFVFLDGAWKVLYGYRPHVDFYSPLGPLNYLPPALAISLYGPDAYALSIAHMVVCLLCISAAWFFLKPRMAPFHAFIYLFFAALVMASWRPPFASYEHVTYSLRYNRQCYAFLILLLPILLLPRYQPTRRGDWLDGIATGILLGLTCFTKISYFVAAAPLVVLGCASTDWRWACRRVTGIALGGLAVTLPVLWYQHFDLAAMYGDLSLAYKARMGSQGVLTILTSDIGVMEALVALSLLMWIVMEVPRPRMCSFLLLIGAAWVSEKLIVATNCRNPQVSIFADAPLLLASLILPIESVYRSFADARASSTPEQPRLGQAYFLVLALGTAALGGSMLRDVASLGFACKAHHEERLSRERFDSPTLRSLIITESAMPSELLVMFGDPRGPSIIGPGTFGTYADKVNDGFHLLESHAAPTARVDVLDFTNPYQFGAARPPSTAPNWWHLTVNVGPHAFPDPDHAFRNTDVIMVPMYVVHGLRANAGFLRRTYAPYLAANFDVTAESPYWTMYTRKATPPRP